MTSTRKIPFRWILPLAQLAICVALLWPLRGFIALQIQGVAHAIWPATVQAPVYFLHPTAITVAPQLRPAGPSSDRSTTLVELRLQIPALLNFPCAFLGLLRIGPPAMIREIWRALSFPTIGILFWWLVGRGVEALAVARQRALSPVLLWPEVVVAVLLVVGNCGLLIGLMVDPSFREDLVFPWHWAAAAAGLWVALSATIVAARIAQWRLKRSAVFL